MKNNGMIKVDGVAICTPSVFEWGLTDVSNSEATRDQDATMYKNRIAQKRKINLKWNAPDLDMIHDILNAFNPEYFDVEYYDPLEGAVITKTFYCGDRNAPVKMWTAGVKRYASVSFNIIER